MWHSKSIHVALYVPSESIILFDVCACSTNTWRQTPLSHTVGGWSFNPNTERVKYDSPQPLTRLKDHGMRSKHIINNYNLLYAWHNCFSYISDYTVDYKVTILEVNSTLVHRRLLLQARRSVRRLQILVINNPLLSDALSKTDDPRPV
jgi:hypothetical protein